MKYILVILSLIVFCSCTSCNSNDSKTDADVIPDKDSVDIDIQDTTPDEKYDPDIIDADNEKPDIDNDSAECLDLKIQANVIKTGFPFKDKNGKPTFCRPRCDTPTETDPQCVRNIWEWVNWSRYQKYIEEEKKDSEQARIRECYPWPCVLPDMKADSTLESFNSKCDRWLTVNGFRADMGTVWSHGMSDGIAGMDMGNDGQPLIIEYNPEKDSYTNLGSIAGRFAYNENRFVSMIYDSSPDDNPAYKSFAVSVLRKDGKYYYELIYDNEKHNAFMSRSPFSGKNWALIQVRQGKNGSKTEVKYAKAGVWEWQNIEGIGDPLAQEGNIVGDHLTFITNDREMYYCDLTKYPKNISDCKKINRLNTDATTYEQGHSPRIDLDNEYRIVYNIYRQNKFVEVDITDINNLKYKEHEVSKNKETTYSWEPETLRGNKLTYADYYIMEAEIVDAIGCFYRFDKKKSYCTVKNIFSTSPDNLMGYNTFWGKWYLWKMINRPDAFMRDMDCYCKETGVCPFEE